MINKIFKIKYLGILLLGLFSPIESQAKDVVFTPNVPIGDFSGPIVVTNDLLGNYINTWYGFVIGAVGIMATVIIMYAGFKWLVSRGNATVIANSKEKIWTAIIGLFLAFSSYMILQIINEDLVNPTLPGLGSGIGVNSTAGSVEPGPVAPVTAADRTAAEQDIRDILDNSDIAVNKEPCPSGVRYQDVYNGCTTLEGLPSNAISGMLQLSDNCKKYTRRDCKGIKVTGGAELGHQTHGINQPVVDLSVGSGDLNGYIINNAQSTRQTSMGMEYTVNGATYLLEYGAHWHVRYP